MIPVVFFSIHWKSFWRLPHSSRDGFPLRPALGSVCGVGEGAGELEKCNSHPGQSAQSPHPALQHPLWQVKGPLCCNVPKKMSPKFLLNSTFRRAKASSRPTSCLFCGLLLSTLRLKEHINSHPPKDVLSPEEYEELRALCRQSQKAERAQQAQQEDEERPPGEEGPATPEGVDSVSHIHLDRICCAPID